MQRALDHIVRRKSRTNRRCRVTRGCECLNIPKLHFRKTTTTRQYIEGGGQRQHQQHSKENNGAEDDNIEANNEEDDNNRRSFLTEQHYKMKCQ